MEDQVRPSVLIYAGDHDPTGEDIDRDFEDRIGVFDKVIRVALSSEQVIEYALPENPDPEVAKKLKEDPRARRFLQRHDALVQYELDALDPDDLRNLYRTAVEQFGDDSVFEAVMEREQYERARL